MRVAVLEDDLVLQAQVRMIIEGLGHACQLFGTVKAVLARLRQESFDLLMLDWNLPDGTGLDVLAWLQANLESRPPVIMLTARGEVDDVVAGLGAGADDYVVKPVDPAILAARTTALLRRAYPAPANAGTEVLHGVRFDHSADRVETAAGEVQLTAKEFALTLLLFRNLNRPLSRSHLLEAVWGHHPDLETRTLDTHVSRIRSKLSLRPEHGFRLAPVYSFGYRLEQVDGRDRADDR